MHVKTDLCRTRSETPKTGFLVTQLMGYSRTFAIKSNSILIGLTEQGKNWITKNIKLIGLLMKVLSEQRL